MEQIERLGGSAQVQVLALIVNPYDHHPGIPYSTHRESELYRRMRLAGYEIVRVRQSDTP